MPKLTFYGGAQEVTGACYLFETDHARLLVDCGLFQCPRFCEKRNAENFPFDPASIDALMVSHGHIDHIGRIPKLVRQGFRGHIYSTHPTKAFADLMLRDSLGVLQKEAHSGDEAVLYEEKDINAVLQLWEGKEYGEEFTVGDVRIHFKNAGHILGSAVIIFEHVNVGRIAFTGDLGNSPTPLLGSFEYVDEATYMVIESAYGNRVHEDVNERKQKLERVIEDTCAHGGTLMIEDFCQNSS